MSLAILHAARKSRTEAHGIVERDPVGWKPRFTAWHTVTCAALLFAVTTWQLVIPGAVLTNWSGALLLVGGAVTGLPHGMSDFLVAHRLLEPRLGRIWLPTFVVAYLGLVLLVLDGWSVVPVFTMVLFLLMSGLHFGAGEDHADLGFRALIAFLARATTPLVPIFLFHSCETGPFIATMTRLPDARVAETLLAVRPLLLGPWIVIVSFAVLQGVGGRAGGTGLAAKSELLALSVAAVMAPPLVTFAIYFCFVHAIRHMANLAGDIHPQHARRAVRHAASILVPSALLCLVALTALWSTLGGAVATTPLICGALQLLAALTVPHMALERLEGSLSR